MFYYNGTSQASDPCGCRSVTNIGTTGGSLNISDTISIPDCALIHGQLVINQNTAWNNIRIIMEEGSEILVKATLTISGTYLSTCDGMWRGIRTQGYPSAISVKDSSVIKGAEFGIRLAPFSKIMCEYSDFINNYIGIACGSPFEEDQDEEIVYQEGHIKGCHFSTQNGLPDPYTGQYYAPSWPTDELIPFNVGYAAIYLTGTTGLNLGKPEAIGIDRNVIEHMRNGVIARKSVIDIYGTDFRDFEGLVFIPKFHHNDDNLKINQSGVNLGFSFTTIKGNLFENIMRGVVTNRTSQSIVSNSFDISTSQTSTDTRGIEMETATLCIVKGNSITHGYIGIRLLGTNEPFLIEENTLTRNLGLRRNVGIQLESIRLFALGTGKVLNNTITTEIGQSASIGISLGNCLGLAIEDNAIYFPVSLNAGQQNAGISGIGVAYSRIVKNDIVGSSAYESLGGNSGIVNTTGRFNYIFCNEMDDIYRGIWLVGPNDRSAIEVNVFEQAFTALELWGPMDLGPNVNDHSGNEWYGDYTGGYGGYISGPNPLQTAEASHFLIDESDLDPCVLKPCPLGPGSVSTGQWFEDNDGTGKSCISIDDPDDPIADTLVALVRSELSFSDYNDEMAWMRKADVFEILLMFPTLLTNTVLDSFYDTEVNSAMGKLVWAQFQLSKRHGLNYSLKKEANDAIYVFAKQVGSLDSLIDLNPVNKSTLLALRVLKCDTLQTWLSDWLGQQTFEEATTYQEIADAMDSVNLVTATNTLESDLKDILLLTGTKYLIDTLTTVAAGSVPYFATQCPWLGGRSLVLGQMLYSMLSDSTLSNTPFECPEPEPFQNEDQIESRSFDARISIYPNPADNMIKLILPEDGMELTIVSVDGRVVLDRTIDGHEMSIETNGFVPGLYTFMIRSRDAVYSHKVSIIR